MSTVKNWWIDHIWLDLLVPALLVVVWASAGSAPIPDAAHAPIHTSLSASAGIALALVSINVTILYQSPDKRMHELHKRHRMALHQLITWELGFLVVAALAPIIGIAVAEPFPQLSTGVALAVSCLVAMALVRLIWLLRLFFTIKGASQAPSPPPGKPPRPKF